MGYYIRFSGTVSAKPETYIRRPLNAPDPQYNYMFHIITFGVVRLNIKRIVLNDAQ